MQKNVNFWAFFTIVIIADNYVSKVVQILIKCWTFPFSNMLTACYKVFPLLLFTSNQPIFGGKIFGKSGGNLRWRRLSADNDCSACPSECAHTPEPFTPSTTHPFVCMFIVWGTHMPQLLVFLIMCVDGRMSPRVRQTGLRVCPVAHLLPCDLPQAGWCGTVAQMLARLFPVAFWQGGGGPFRKRNTRSFTLTKISKNTHLRVKPLPLSRLRQRCNNNTFTWF